MEFWSFYLDVWYWIYLIGVPIIIFSVKGDALIWLKSVRLLFLIILLPMLTAPLDYARTQTLEDYNGHDYGCWMYDLYFVLLAAGISVVYVGWWEYGWRRFHKQIFWDIKKNLQYGIVSNLIVLLSAIITFWHILILAGCKICGMGEIMLLFSAQKFAYEHIIPLVC